MASTHRDDHRGGRQLDGRRHALGNGRGHRLVGRSERAEIAGREPGQKARILHEQRAIEARAGREARPCPAATRSRRASPAPGRQARDESARTRASRRRAGPARRAAGGAHRNRAISRWMPSRVISFVKPCRVTPSSLRRPTPVTACPAPARPARTGLERASSLVQTPSVRRTAPRRSGAAAPPAARRRVADIERPAPPARSAVRERCRANHSAPAPHWLRRRAWPGCSIRRAA